MRSATSWPALEAALAQARERERQVVADDRRALEAELAQAGAEHARAAEALARQLWRGALVELRAPASGTVKDLASRTPGAVLGQGRGLRHASSPPATASWPRCWSGTRTPASCVPACRRA